MDRGEVRSTRLASEGSYEMSSHSRDADTSDLSSASEHQDPDTGGTLSAVGSVRAGRLLIVEDDEPLARFLGRTLNAQSFVVDLVHDGQSAIEMLNVSPYDLVILDLNLPKVDGLSLLNQLRPSHPRLPILVLTARSRDEALVTALESGADDCLIKPFSFIELIARVRALMRRNAGFVPIASRVADLTLNREEYKVERNGRRIDLTPREFGILECLMRSMGSPVSRTTLMREVWNTEYDPSTNVVDVYMKYVRDKIDLPGETKLIRTIRGVGYVIQS